MAQRDARAAEPAINIENERVMVLPRLAVRAAGDKLPRKRPGLQPAALSWSTAVDQEYRPSKSGSIVMRSEW